MGGSYNKDGRGKDSKKVLNRNFHTTRSVRRPRTRWVDAVQGDALQLLGIREWRRRTANRDEWMHLVREAKASRGCSAIDGWIGTVSLSKTVTT
jgi:hypothetical protein